MPHEVPSEGSSDVVEGLREAVRVCPDHVPLRHALGQALLDLGRAAAAEREFREALQLAPERIGLKIGLAHAFFAQEKNGLALALIESVTHAAEPPAEALLLHARVLAASGEIDAAVVQYRRALERDATRSDPELAEQLGLDPDLLDARSMDARSVVASDDDEGADEDEPILAPPSVERPPIQFEHVGGMDAVKEEIRLKIIHPMAHAELFRIYGKPVGGGILMYGPPGCGKTHLARATAGEIKAGFINVGINDVLDMWLGRSERNLHDLFETARRHRPCVLFFDEIDALGGSRSDLRQQSGRQLVNQFLAEFDGAHASNEGVLVLAATNAPWHLDPAFRRPGRFDRLLFVPPPDLVARTAILRILLAGKPQVELDYQTAARHTEGFSGADLQAVVDVAIEGRLRDAIRAGLPKPITTRDLLAAASGLKPTTREWFASARNYALYANQGGLYDDIAAYLKLK